MKLRYREVKWLHQAVSKVTAEAGTPTANLVLCSLQKVRGPRKNLEVGTRGILQGRQNRVET